MTSPLTVLESFCIIGSTCLVFLGKFRGIGGGVPAGLEGGKVMGERLIGTVKDYFRKVEVMTLELEGLIKVGDTIHIKGHTTDLTQAVESMQIEHAEVQEGGPGDLVGIKVAERVRPGDSVFVVEDSG
jgi:putative protease